VQTPVVTGQRVRAAAFAVTPAAVGAGFALPARGGTEDHRRFFQQLWFRAVVIGIGVLVAMVILVLELPSALSVPW